MTTTLYRRALKDAGFSIRHHLTLVEDRDWPDDPEPTPAMVKAALLHEMFYAVRAVFQPEMPLAVINKSRMSAAILINGGNQDTARALGRTVQAWRDNANQCADAALRAALVKLERMKK